MHDADDWEDGRDADLPPSAVQQGAPALDETPMADADATPGAAAWGPTL